MQYIWAHGKCLRCDTLDRNALQRAKEADTEHNALKWMVTLPEQRKSTERARRPIRKRKAKPTKTEAWLQDHFGFKSQVEVFNFLWLTRPMVCEFTGISLKPFEDDEQMRRTCCAHYLRKGLFPLWKLNPDNITLVHPEFHRIVDMSTLDERAEHPDWDFVKWDAEVALRKIQYKLFKREHLL